MIVTGLPLGSLNPAWTSRQDRADRLRRVDRANTVRDFEGNSRSRSGWIGLKATIVSCRGFTLKVSFQPNSLASGGLTALSQATRLMSCALKRWTWIV